MDCGGGGPVLLRLAISCSVRGRPICTARQCCARLCLGGLGSCQRAHDAAEPPEARHLRRMTHATREEGEGWVEYHRLRRARASHCRSCSKFVPLWDRRCSVVHSWRGHVVRHPEGPPSAPSLWRGPRRWRAVQALADDGPVDTPHPRKNWTRPAEAAILAWAGDGAHDTALDRSGWAASRSDFVTC